MINDTPDLSMAEAGEMVLDIRDVNPKDLERIFNPFEQVEQSASRRFPGTGLGLSLTKSLVEIQGGKIWAEGEGLGSGAIFRFIIPF